MEVTFQPSRQSPRVDEAPLRRLIARILYFPLFQQVGLKTNRSMKVGELF